MTKAEAIEILNAPSDKWLEFRNEAEKTCAAARDEHGWIYCSNCLNQGIISCCPSASPPGLDVRLEFCAFYEGAGVCQ